MKKLETGLNRLKDCYIFAHLTYSILTATCLVGWLRTTQMQLTDGYNLLWFICMVAALALIPAQHKIISKTFLGDHQHLHIYKSLYTFTICAIYIPIITGVIAMTGLSILTIVPVILTSIVCGTVYGIITALVMSLSIITTGIIQTNINTDFITEQVLILALLTTTAWFIGQSFEYTKTLFYQLWSSDKYLKQTMNNLGIATLHVDHRGRVIHSNQCFNELIKTAIKEDEPITEIAARHLPFLNTGGFQLRDEKSGANPVFGQAVDSRGRLIPVQCIVYPVNFGLDNGSTFVCIHDISLSQKLEQEKVLTSYFISFINAGVILADASGSIIELNQQAECLLSTTRQQLLNQTLAEYLGRMAGNTAGPFKSDNYEMELGDRALLINCADLCDKSGGIIGYICIINDISDRKETERKMQRSATLSAIGELAAGTAHEIRNPLTSIRGFLQLIMEKKANRIGDMESYFKIILSEVDRINVIVLEFLKLARPGNMQMQRINLNEIIDSIWELLHNEAVLREVKLSRFQEPGLPPLKGNADMIKQVIINLINNAIQAAGPKGTVQLITLKYRNGARLSVEDNGPGIDKSLQARIFDPYFTTRDEGTGLGLAITSKIVYDHNGSINVLSTPGKGARFNVDLPSCTEELASVHEGK
ncbi:MAG: ATP-binding protein [Desulfotomaculaceae bacterium]